ncbi:hypothetical protein [Acetobacter oeni]|uniref:hypothetical protein n=1 Tax=Acetobacter oeni TaxID=304077 RepID=UPI0015685119|nr:hypothetical protein [Acetobacter oeni]
MPKVGAVASFQLEKINTIILHEDAARRNEAATPVRSSAFLGDMMGRGWRKIGRHQSC